MIGITCWVTLVTPKKFVSNCAFISSNDRSSNAPKRPYPAHQFFLFPTQCFLIRFFTELSPVTSSCIGFKGSRSVLAIDWRVADLLISRTEACIKTVSS